MKKVGIHSLTLVALLISSLLMASYAYQNFRSDEFSYGLVCAALSLFLGGLVVYGLVRNRRIRDE